MILKEFKSRRRKKEEKNLDILQKKYMRIVNIKYASKTNI